MPLTRPIPKVALVIVEVIRQTTKRPKAWELMQIFPTRLNRRVIRFNRTKGFCCPMGLVPTSSSECPDSYEDFAGGNFGTREVLSFGKWWDEQDDPQAAIDAIWPEERL